MAKLVTLDFTNTLARVSKTVGYHYARAAEQYGITVTEQGLNKHFRTQYLKFWEQSPNFSAYDTSPDCREWWNKVVMETYRSCGVTNADSTLRTISNELYTEFTKQQYWEVYEDVEVFLKGLKKLGGDDPVITGIISNFDDRLECILRELGLNDYFDFIVCSYKEKCHKPNSQIFEIAVKKAAALVADKIDNHSIWHVGNDLVCDYHGAEDYGVKPVLLCRSKEGKQQLQDTVVRVESLEGLPPLLARQ